MSERVDILEIIEALEKISEIGVGASIIGGFESALNRATDIAEELLEKIKND